MPILVNDTFFHDADQGVHMSKAFGGDKHLYCHISFGIDTFTDYQQDLFQDFLGMLVDALEDDMVDVFSFKTFFEQQLQDINTKLSVFAEKIADVERFPLKGIVQIFFGREYFAALVGPTGLMVVRDSMLNFMMSNQEDDGAPINLFSEMIEGELKEYDEVIALGVPIDTYIDKHDFITIRDLSKKEEKSFVIALIDVLQVRVDVDTLAFVSSAVVESSSVFSQKKIKRNMTSKFQQMTKLSQQWAPYQGYIVYGIIGFVGLLMMYWLVQSFLSSNNTRFIDESGGIVIDFTIEDVQKDIAIFKRIDPGSDEKITKYQEIVDKLTVLEQNNRWTNDVTELKKILEAEYYQGFNIVLAHNDSFFQAPVYSFTQQEQNTFAGVEQVFYTDALIVAGNEGVLLGAVNNDVRGTLVSAATDMTFGTCSLNLLKNGLYCTTAAGTIYNIGKSGLSPVTNAASIFPSAIAQLGTFGSSNFYTLTHDPSLNNAGTYVVRYTNVLGTQESFGEGTEYILVGDGDADSIFASGGASSFAIDGTFLTWSANESALYQLWRSDASANLQYREIPLLGGDTVEAYGPNTKVIASAESRLVYLFDKDNQTFTVYRSTPYKTNDANTYTYSLQYFFRIKFSAADKNVVDVFVVEGERSQLYLLTDTGVYAIKLYDYIDSFFAKEGGEQ